ncbi:F-box only protein 40-like isoform X1 [Paramormyrops kingsleyae]|uniref:F-box only protein 40-like isoform X1 n=2 Tax=Paramormyrops kingsleyae TaxID=1676925 RepID=UPI003B96C9E8
MGRNRTVSVKQHQHCEKCFNRYCKARVEVSVSCLVISCRLYCGAVFHMCKDEEHQLLCPNEVVPCLNAEFGCPFTMCRYKLGEHLKECPSSIVNCSMDWNRWPAEEAELVLYDNMLNEPYSDKQLDLSLALRDQKHLFSSLKMKSLFAELVEVTKEETPMLEGAVGGTDFAKAEHDFKPLDDGIIEEEMEGLTQEEREALAKDTSIVNPEKFNMWEKMFSMEMSGCKQTGKVLESSEKHSEEGNLLKSGSQSKTVPEETKKTENSTDVSNKTNDVHNDQTPRQDVNMPRSYSQALPCNPKGKSFFYGSLEPMKMKTVRTFKVPTSFRAKHGRIRNPAVTKKDNKCVDTSDLGVSLGDLPKWDEIQATLLCCLEKELRGHLVSNAASTDALLCDSGTQTYDFLSAPFKKNASLADVTAARTLKLHLQIHSESVTNRHNKASSAFTFLCGHYFRRDEFSSHFKNVHADIQSCLNGWFEERCPLAYLGCTYSQMRFQPSTQRATVSYNEELSTFTLKPDVCTAHLEGATAIRTERKRARNLDAFSRLPFEVLVHIATFLDSFTLSQLALVSHHMRDVCATLLPERGMVSLKWEKKTYSHGGSCWKCKKKVWQFSSLFSRVDSWSFRCTPSMAEHLKLCPFYQAERKSDPVALVSMGYDKNEEAKHQTLVSLLGSKAKVRKHKC